MSLSKVMGLLAKLSDYEAAFIDVEADREYHQAVEVAQDVEVSSRVA